MSDFAWTQNQVKSKWEEFCSDLLSINEQKFLDCKLFPNPTSDYINISMKQNAISEIEITNVLGKIVLHSMVQGNNVRMNVSDLNPGVYMVRIKTVDRNIRVKLFNKN